MRDGIGETMQKRARLALAAAIGGGLATQALFWKTSIGLNWLLVELGAILAMVAYFGPRAVRSGALAAIAVALGLGASIVVYAGEWQLWIAVPSSFAIVAALPTVLRERLTLRELGALPGAILGASRGVPGAIVGTARLPVEALEGSGGAWAKSLLRGTLLGAPVAGFFALLFASDAKFSGAILSGTARFGEWVCFAAASGVTTVFYLLHLGLERALAVTPRVDPGGAPPYRLAASPDARPPAPRISPLTWGVVLAQVAGVFAIFVAANRRELFGGHAIVRASDGPTYAAYLHTGFGQLLFASILGVGLVLAGHHWMRPRGAIGPAPGGRGLAVVESALLVLAAVTVASCWQRLAVYDDAYGTTHLRLGVAVLEVAVLGALALTAVKAIARGWRGYPGALIGFFALLSAGASALDADAIIAARNLDRAERGKPLDVEYLGSLSRDACRELDHPGLGPSERYELGMRWIAPRTGDWRSFRGLATCPR